MAHWFIKRPHAIERFKLRGNFPTETDDTILESLLRQALSEVEAKGQLVEGCRPGEFAARISIPNRNTVYAIVKPTPGQDYTHFVPTVLTSAMYRTWHDEVDFKEPDHPKLTPFETIPAGYVESQNSERPSIKSLPSKPTLFISYKVIKGTEVTEITNEFLAEDVGAQVAKLMEEGVLFRNIKVLREIPLKIDIKLGGITR